MYTSLEAPACHVNRTSQRFAGFGGNHFGHSAEAPSLTGGQLAAGVALGAPRLPHNPADACGATAMVNV